MEKSINASAVVSDSKEAAKLIKEMLKDQASIETEFISALRNSPVVLKHAVIKSLFETSIATTNASSQRCMLRAASQNLSELQFQVQQLQDSIKRHFGFHRHVQLSEGMSSINLECPMFDETEPFEMVLADGQRLIVPDDLHEQVFQQGVVSELVVRYPRSDRYGIPEAATEAGGLRWLWDMGFSVVPHLSVIGRDTGDDSANSAKIEIYLPTSLIKEIRDQGHVY